MSNSHGKTLVFIPTYNDFSHLQLLVDEVTSSQSDAEVLVVDDGSETTSPQLARCHYVKLPFNLGLGVSTRLAVDYAHQHNFSTVVRIDADGQHPVDKIPLLLHALESADVAIAVRANRHGLSGVKELLATVARSYITVVSRLSMSGKLPNDMNSGFIALGSRGIELLRKYELDRYPEPQMMIIAATNRLDIASVYIEQNERVSGSSTITIIAALRMLYRVTLYTLLAMTGAYNP